MSLRLVPGTAKTPPRTAQAAPGEATPAAALRVIDCRPDLFESLRQNGSRPQRRWPLALVLVLLLAAALAAVILLAR